MFDLLLEVIFFLFTIGKHVCVKDSSAKGTCGKSKNRHTFLGRLPGHKLVAELALH